MNDIFVLLYFFVQFLIVVVFPTLIVAWLYKRLRRTKVKKYAFLLPCLITSFLACEIYFAIYPNSDFYKQDFEYLSKMKFPESATIVYKDADYPDIHGHYSSVMLVRLPTQQRDKMLSTISHDATFKKCNMLYNLSAYKKASFKENDIREQFYKGKLLISFFKDSQTILVQRGIS